MTDLYALEISLPYKVISSIKQDISGKIETFEKLLHNKHLDNGIKPKSDLVTQLKNGWAVDKRKRVNEIKCRDRS